MRQWLLFFAVVGCSGAAGAAELDVEVLRGSVVPNRQVADANIPSQFERPSAVYKAPPPMWSWTGFYAGPQIGGAVSVANFADPFGSSIFGDKVVSPGFLAGGQIGFNWQVPNSPWVLGVEA